MSENDLLDVDSMTNDELKNMYKKLRAAYYRRERVFDVFIEDYNEVIDKCNKLTELSGRELVKEAHTFFISKCDKTRLIEGYEFEERENLYKGEKYKVVKNTLLRYYITSYGRVYDRLSGRFVVQFRDAQGYYAVMLSQIHRTDKVVGGKRIVKRKLVVHNAVLNYFVGKRPEGMLGLHKDDIKTHNSVDNLYWGTHLDNSDDVRINKEIKSDGKYIKVYYQSELVNKFDSAGINEKV